MLADDSAMPSVTAQTRPAPVTATPTTQLTGEEHEAAMARCLREQGWEVRVVTDDPQGGYDIEYPVEQQGQFDVDRNACLAIYGSGIPEYDEASAGEVYDELMVMAGCVEEAGFPISDPPSKASWVEAFVARPIPPWHPYDEAVDAGQLAAVEAACPPPE